MKLGTEDKLVPEDQILLLCARTRLNEEQSAAIAMLSEGLVDWKALVAKTVPHRMAALTFHHLKPFLEQAGDTEALATLRNLAFSQVASYLRIAVAQKYLSEQVLVPLDVPHVFIKGVGLAEQLYPNPSQRIGRDIDVWVNPDTMADVWDCLKGLGYRRREKPDQTHQIPIHHAAFLLPQIDIMGPDGTVIEIHTRYDHSGLTIDPMEMHARSEQIETSIGPVRVPRFEDHFIYVCQHHTRHLWARLRWFGDLDAFEKSPRFDRDSILERAAEMSLSSTVEACLELSESLSDPARLTTACRTPQATELKKWIIRCLSDSPDAAHEDQARRISADFALPWQYDWRHLARLRFSKLRPTQGDYLARPREPEEWWKYYFTRPFRLLRSAFGRH